MRNLPRGAQCALEQPPVPAASCASKFRENHAESASAIASPVSVEREASLQRWPASPLPMRSLALRPSTFASVTREPGSDSGSALSAGRPCSTPRRVMNSRLWTSPWERLPTRPSLRLGIRSMTAADMLGFSYRQAPRRTTRTQPDRQPLPLAQRQTCRLIPLPTCGGHAHPDREEGVGPATSDTHAELETPVEGERQRAEAVLRMVHELEVVAVRVRERLRIVRRHDRAWP